LILYSTPKLTNHHNIDVEILIIMNKLKFIYIFLLTLIGSFSFLKYNVAHINKPNLNYILNLILIAKLSI
jgi:hypothetical protein